MEVKYPDHWDDASNDSRRIREITPPSSPFASHKQSKNCHWENSRIKNQERKNPKISQCDFVPIPLLGPAGQRCSPPLFSHNAKRGDHSRNRTKTTKLVAKKSCHKPETSNTIQTKQTISGRVSHPTANRSCQVSLPIEIIGLMVVLIPARVLTLEVACSIAAIREKWWGRAPNSQPTLRASQGSIVRSTDTYRVEDVVIVTAHTTRVLIAVVRIREPLWGAIVTTRARAK